MAAAIAAAEERWAAERKTMASELSWLRAQKEEDTAVLRQTAALVQMLQESHRALIESNAKLLSQLKEQKEQHDLEVTQFQRHFDELLLTQPLPPRLHQTGAAPATGTPLVRKEARVAAR